ncbi:bifunctional DNA primase/polymerase [Micropruina sp.]|uniref:bifunctional DNA primase/polymerase n=1 Tax=Micropruina sp. TaxID=2737536 RepID=UPI0039E2A832
MTATQGRRPETNGTAAEDMASVAPSAALRLDPGKYSDPLMVAASVAACGWPVIPLWSDTRVPIGAGGERHRGIWCQTAAEVLACAESLAERFGCDGRPGPAPSWGVVLGEPNRDGLRLVVADTDSHDAEQWLQAAMAEAGAESWGASTMRAATHRGWHRYGVTDREVPTGKPWPGLDLKAVGGYVVLPNCRHPAGGRYQDVTGPNGTILTAGEHPGGPAVYRSVTSCPDGLRGAWSVPMLWPAALLDRLTARETPESPAPVPELLAVAAGALTPTGETFSGPSADRASAYSRGVVDGVQGDLVAASDWPAGHRDERGRGWEKLTADAALKLARLALADWSGFSLDQVRRVFLGAAPTDQHWTGRDVRAKWDSQVRAARRKGPLPAPADVPTGRAWLDPAGILVVDLTDEPTAGEMAADDEAAARAPAAAEPAPTLAEVRSDGPETDAGWGRMDLSAILDAAEAGELVMPLPTVGTVDGSDAGLFYERCVNGVAGESGSGKSWLALTVGLRRMEADHPFLYLDFEDSPERAVARLMMLGADVPMLREHFHYCKPVSHSRAAVLALAEVVRAMNSPLVVLDSTGEAMSLAGAKQNDDNETALWFAAVARPLAEAGGCVVLLDHMTKAPDGGLWPIGSQRKRAAVTGAQYVAQVVEPFSRGQNGCTKLVVAKDRHGARAKGEVASFVRFTHPIASRVEESDGSVSVVLSDELTVTFGRGKTVDEVRVEQETQGDKDLAADVLMLTLLDPPPTSQRDVIARMKWGGNRAMAALKEWRRLNAQGGGE